MPGPFDKDTLSVAQYVAELRSRGFTFNENRQLWVGPFGITVTAVANKSNFHIVSGINNPTGIGNSGITGGGFVPGISGLRKSLLAEIDEKLRAKRGQPRPLFRTPFPPGQ